MWQQPLPVAPDLRGVAACAWRATVQGEHLLVPDGCVDVLWLAPRGLWVCGPEERAWTFRLPPGTEAVGVRLRPGVARRLFRTDMQHIVDRRVTVADCLGAKEHRRSTARLAEASDPLPVLVDLVRRWAVLAEGPGPIESALLANAVAPTPLPLASVADDAGVSVRALHRHAVRSFGYGASVLHRLVRFQRVLWHAGRAPGTPLAVLAAAGGYVDQAHLTRECRAITGVPPSVFLASYSPTFPAASDPYKTPASVPA